MDKRTQIDPKKWTCKECGVPCPSPRELGMHYEEFPDHRPIKPEPKRRKKRFELGGEAGPGRPMGLKNKKTISREFSEVLLDVLRLYGEDDNPALGILKWLQKDDARWEKYFDLILPGMLEKLVPAKMSPEELALLQDKMGGGGGQNITIVTGALPIPDTTQENSQKLIENLEDEAIIDVKAEEKETWDDDFPELNKGKDDEDELEDENQVND